MAEIIEVGRNPDGIEIKYSDGSREKINAGRVERKDANENKIVERTATETETERMIARALLASPPSSANDNGTPDPGPGPGEKPGTTLSGGSGNYVINGGGGDIESRAGRDFLNDGSGFDKLKGGFGQIILFGGSGREGCEFEFMRDSDAGALGDIFRDFASGAGVIVVR